MTLLRLIIFTALFVGAVKTTELINLFFNKKLIKLTIKVVFPVPAYPYKP